MCAWWQRSITTAQSNHNLLCIELHDRCVCFDAFMNQLLHMLLDYNVYIVLQVLLLVINTAEKKVYATTTMSTMIKRTSIVYSRAHHIHESYVHNAGTMTLHCAYYAINSFDLNKNYTLWQWDVLVCGSCLQKVKVTSVHGI